MEAFGYEPEKTPDEEDFGMPLTLRQSNYLAQVKESYGRPGKQFKELCDAILEAYGLTTERLCYGRAEVLIDFFSKSAARHKRAAERKAWQEYL